MRADESLRGAVVWALRPAGIDVGRRIARVAGRYETRSTLRGNGSGGMRMRLCVRAVCTVLLVPAMLVGLVASGQPAASEIKIGAVLPLTGAFGSSGNYFKQGYTMAIDDVNKAGGLEVGGRRYQITLTILDDGSDATRSRSLVEKLVTDQHVNFLLGGYDTSLVEAQEVVPDQYKIPYVEGGGAASEIFRRG